MVNYVAMEPLTCSVAVKTMQLSIHLQNVNQMSMLCCGKLKFFVAMTKLLHALSALTKSVAMVKLRVCCYGKSLYALLLL